MNVPWYLMAKGKGGGGYKTASGPIVSISDALAAPLRSLRVGIDPVQDLHGYDAPWPAGGGKNQWDEEWELGVWSGTGEKSNSDTAIRCKNRIKVTPSTQYYIVFPVATFTRGMIVREIASDYSVVKTDTPSTSGTITTTATTEYLVFCSYAADNVTTYNNNIAINYPATATTYAPYSNICPISGWSAVNVWRTGKNLVQNTGAGRTNANVEYSVNADGSVKAYGTATATSWWRGVAPLSDWRYIKAGTYRLTGGLSNNKMVYIVGQYADGTPVLNSTVIGGVYDKGSGLTFTLSKDAYINYQIQINNGTVVDDTFYPMICRDTSAAASDYEPYQGDTYTIQLGQTIYGGTLDVTNGVLRVDYRLLNAADVTWRKSGDVVFYAPSDLYTTVSADTPTGRKPLLCNTFSYYSGSSVRDGDIGYGGINNNGNITIRSSVVASTLEDWNDYIANNTVQIVYPLATPITIPLSDITISTLAGQNVVWADCGDVTVEYLSAGGANADLMKLAVAFMGRK